MTVITNQASLQNWYKTLLKSNIKSHCGSYVNISKWYPHLLCFSASDIYFRSAFLLFMCALLVSVSEQGQIILLCWESFF